MGSRGSSLISRNLPTPSSNQSECDSMWYVATTLREVDTLVRIHSTGPLSTLVHLAWVRIFEIPRPGHVLACVLLLFVPLHGRTPTEGGAVPSHRPSCAKAHQPVARKGLSPASPWRDSATGVRTPFSRGEPPRGDPCGGTQPCPSRSRSRHPGCAWLPRTRGSGSERPGRRSSRCLGAVLPSDRR